MNRFAIWAAILPVAIFFSGAGQNPASAETNSKQKPPFIIRNPDGTITVQKGAPPGKTGPARKGLVIPPQVVVPTVRVPAKQGAN